MIRNIENFKLIKTVGNDPKDWKFLGTVEVTTGILWFKKTTTTREIFRSYANFWYFTDNGKFVPHMIFEAVSIFETNNAKKLYEM